MIVYFLLIKLFLCVCVIHVVNVLAGEGVGYRLIGLSKFPQVSKWGLDCVNADLTC